MSGPPSSPALSPVQSAMTPGCGVVFLDAEDDLHQSEPMSAILVKMPPATRRAAAPEFLNKYSDSVTNQYQDYIGIMANESKKIYSRDAALTIHGMNLLLG